MKGQNNKYSLSLGLNHIADLLNYHRTGTREFAKSAVETISQTVSDLEKFIAKPVSEIKILELGCGQRYQNVILLSSLGIDIIGGDTEIVGPGFSKYMSMLKEFGFVRIIKTLFRSILFDNLYYKTLESKFGSKLSTKNLKILRLDAAKIPFPSESFDAVISNDVFEHIKDVESAVSEINRVLKKGGISINSIHLFPSISGGHNLQWENIEKLTKNTNPWGHLRNNSYPSHVYLNRLRRKDYEEFFKRYMQILNIEASRSGEKFLTKTILNELLKKGYSKRELLETELRIVSAKKILPANQ